MLLAEAMPCRGPASMWHPLGGCSTSRGASSCIPRSSPVLSGAFPSGQSSHSRRLALRVSAQYDRQFDRQPGNSGRGRAGTEYMDDRYKTRGDYDYPPPPGSKGHSRDWPPSPPTEEGYGGSGGPPNGNGGDPNGSGGRPMDNFTKAVIAGAFIMGMGTGVWFNSEATFYPSNVASTEVIDRRTPNSEVCMANGYSSMVFDERVFVSFNPFNVYVTQPEVKPGCVLRRANIGLLEKKKLVTDHEVSACTKNMNTFGFVGDLNGSPEVSCVYHSEEGENQFLRDPKRSVMGDGFQPHELLDPGRKAAEPSQN